RASAHAFAHHDPSLMLELMRTLPLLLCLLAACPSSKQAPRAAAAESATPTADSRTQPADGSVARAGSTDARCPEGMVYIPAATFMMGTTVDDPNDRLHQVTLTKPYCIDRTPVTVADYRKCVEAKACSEPHKPLDYNYGRPGRDDHPVNAVEWAQADTYCTWAKKRLPTDAEWELAARGTDGRKYPWGNEEPDDTRLWWSRSVDREGTAPVGSHPAGASPYGVLDMLGNVSQWVRDHDANFTEDAQTDPIGPLDGESRVVRGTGYDIKLGDLHVGHRYSLNPTVETSSTGFRCARAPR
ncbi:MAG: Protein kinase, partial [Myxococcaceae bacterium]|nr:Protein kinase [Myxococcaceae bacterium]